MNRRDFLRYLLATPIVMELDVERLLWVPGERTIFIPNHQNIGALVAAAWEEYVKRTADSILMQALPAQELTTYAYTML